MWSTQNTVGDLPVEADDEVHQLVEQEPIAKHVSILALTKYLQQPTAFSRNLDLCRGPPESPLSFVHYDRILFESYSSGIKPTLSHISR